MADKWPRIRRRSKRFLSAKIFKYSFYLPNPTSDGIERIAKILGRTTLFFKLYIKHYIRIIYFSIKETYREIKIVKLITAGIWSLTLFSFEPLRYQLNYVWNIPPRYTCLVARIYHRKHTSLQWEKLQDEKRSQEMNNTRNIEQNTWMDNCCGSKIWIKAQKNFNWIDIFSQVSLVFHIFSLLKSLSCSK